MGGIDKDDKFVLNAFKEAVSQSDEAASAKRAFKSARQAMNTALFNRLSPEMVDKLHEATSADKALDKALVGFVAEFIEIAFLFGFRSGVLYQEKKVGK